ncbi:MAG TPA: DUF4340 domain-containing protein, partial [Bacteroidota bacterium]|nr:DUF4340 domain-containing protein [Bacteroidota bacterium]
GIGRPGKTLTIEKVGGVWTITSEGNLRADPAAVNQVIGGLSRFKPGSLVSDNPAKQGLFQVDSSGSIVTLTDREGNKCSIIIGKMGPSFSEVYFRIPGTTVVYLGSGITTWSLNKEVRDWRDKTIFAAPAEAVTGVKIVSAGKSREYTRDSTGWTSGRETVPTETINPILNTLAGIRADDFIDSTVEFSEPPATVEVSGAAGATLNFYRLRSDTDKYAVVSSASPQVYIVGRHVASGLFKTVGEPKALSVPVAARPAPPTRKESAAASGRARTPATPPVTRRTSTPPATSAGGAGAVTGSKTGATTEPAKVNPFKQKPAGEQQPPGNRVSTPAPARTPARTPARQQTQPAVKTPAQTPAQAGEDEGELTVHIVKKGETMTTIAKNYGVTVEQILKWNLLKSISVSPGQELYVFLRK